MPNSDRSPLPCLITSRKSLWGVTALATVGVLITNIPIPSAQADNYQLNPSAVDYQTCVKGVLSTGVQAKEAGAACAAALRPTDVSKCVTKINGQTKITGIDALNSCQRVRRPNELATCVVNINSLSKTPATDTLSILDSCRRSLLPERFAQCVVGLSGQINSPTSEIMNTCLDARDPLTSTLDNTPAATPMPQLTPTPEATPMTQPTPSPVLQPIPIPEPNK
jgi:hypothetical protein